MERKIGEIFKYDGEWYQCLKSNGTCVDCAGFSKYYDFCYGFDGCTGRIFKKIHKTGEPFSDYCPDGRIIYFQRYECYQEPIIEGDIIWHWVDPTLIDIEIKQNKENNMEEKKLNLKPFDLDKAKAGKQVCTRDGRKARVVCFDYNGETGDYPIVALVSYNKGNNCYERILKYTSDGLFNKYGDYEHDDDLMMLPERKEGWAKVRKDINLYDTKEEADRKMIGNGDYVTAKVYWEE